MIVNRRKFIEMSLILGLIHTSPKLLAQSSQSTINRIRNNRIKANQLKISMCGVNLQRERNKAKMISYNYREYRLELFKILNATKGELTKYILDEQRQLANNIVAEGLPLLPNETEIIIETMPTINTLECERIPELLFDIIIEALSLQEVKNVIKKLITITPGFEENVDKFAKSIYFRDLEQAIDICLIIIDHLKDANNIAYVATQFRKEARIAYRIFLAKLGLRFVPFVGWVYMGITFAAAIYNNSDRIIKVVDCVYNQETP